MEKTYGTGDWFVTLDGVSYFFETESEAIGFAAKTAIGHNKRVYVTEVGGPASVVCEPDGNWDYL